MKLALVAKGVGQVLRKHSPEILTGLGIAGMVSTTIFAVKATPKAIQLLEQKKAEEEVEKLAPVEVVKTTWKCYIPTVITGVASAACLIGASSVSVRRNAALATAYTISETALKEYKNKVIETIGENKEKEVREAVLQDKVKNEPVSNKTVHITSHGDSLCCDYFSGRYFRCSAEKLRRAENTINHKAFVEGYASLNDFYEEVGLERNGIGESVGWRCEQGGIKMYFTYEGDTNEEPTLIFAFENDPKYDYDKNW